MNVTKDYFMTVIVPVFNERDNMQRLEEELIKYLKTARLASCILFVDDGSTDGSTQMIKMSARGTRICSTCRSKRTAGIPPP